MTYIRPALSQDIPTISAFLIKTFKQSLEQAELGHLFPLYIESLSPEALRERLKGNYKAYIYHYRGVAVGYVEWQDQTLSLLGVDPTLQRQGIAKELVRKLCCHLHAPYIFAKVPQINTEVFQSLGFEINGSPFDIDGIPHLEFLYQTPCHKELRLVGE